MEVLNFRKYRTIERKRSSAHWHQFCDALRNALGVQCQPCADRMHGTKGADRVDTAVMTTHEVFFEPRRLVVPLFQRAYVWSKDEQWEPLWSDILAIIARTRAGEREVSHFLGAVVMQEQHSGQRAMRAATVIDGQQRLTTLQLLLRALYSALEERDLEDLARDVLHLIENPEVYLRGPHDQFKVWPTHRDQGAFAAVMGSPIDEDPHPNDRLTEAHEYFAATIANWLDDSADSSQSAVELVTAVTQHLQVVSIRLGKDEDAQAIFETLNARGAPLSPADLIKNFVFHALGRDEEAMERAYRKHWKLFEEPFWEQEVSVGSLTHTRTSLFLIQWLTARTLEEIPHKRVFDRFKRYAQGREMAELVAQVRDSADRYQRMIVQSEVKNGPLDRLELFVYRTEALDSEITKPFLIWLGEPEQAGISIAERDRLLEVLESWLVRRTLVRAPSAGVNRFLLEILQHLARTAQTSLAHEAADFLAGQSSTVGYWPDDEQVRRDLTPARAYHQFRRSRLRMVLEAIEDGRRGYPASGRYAEGPVVRGTCQIEHILPQSWRANWGAGLDPVQEAHRERLVHTLGNLTLTTGALNARLSNAAWLGAAGKRATLDQHSSILMTRQIIRDHAERWTDGDIEARTESLIIEILALWPVPEGHTVVTTADVDRSAWYFSVLDIVKAEKLRPEDVLFARPGDHGHRTASVGADGWLEIDGHKFETPGAAGKHLTGHGVDGWSFWYIDELRTRRLGELRDEVRGTANPAWDRLRSICAAIPAGNWTSYGELGAAVGAHAIGVGNYLSTRQVPNSWRVLTVDGRVAPEFRWPDGRTDDPSELLKADGVRFVGGKADPAQRLGSDELQQLVSVDRDSGSSS